MRKGKGRGKRGEGEEKRKEGRGGENGKRMEIGTILTFAPPRTETVGYAPDMK